LNPTNAAGQAKLAPGSPSRWTLQVVCVDHDLGGAANVLQPRCGRCAVANRLERMHDVGLELMDTVEDFAEDRGLRRDAPTR
jgi:hypothetical protein